MHLRLRNSCFRFYSFFVCHLLFVFPINLCPIFFLDRNCSPCFCNNNMHCRAAPSRRSIFCDAGWRKSMEGINRLVPVFPVCKKKTPRKVLSFTDAESNLQIVPILLYIYSYFNRFTSSFHDYPNFRKVFVLPKVPLPIHICSVVFICQDFILRATSATQKVSSYHFCTTSS